MAEARQPRTPTPQEKARLEAMKKNWGERRQISERVGRIKTKIGVYSAKGGVGKTTVAVNLAATLAKQGYHVGLFDTDIDCPNAAQVLGVMNPFVYTGGEFIPTETYGVKILSMSFFQENPEEAIIWRGPMLHNVLNQLLQNTDWGDLDYLIVDLPPGTSDVPLTIMQTLKLDGFVVVTTPQTLSKLDAKRCINMIKKLNVKVLGIVENFSGGVFGSGAGRELALDLNLPFLADFQLRSDYAIEGGPTVLANDQVQLEYDHLVTGMLERLEALGHPVAQEEETSARD